MKRFPLKLTYTVLLLFAAGCSSAPPKPVLPDGFHRVPVNVSPSTPDASTVPGDAK